MKEILLDVLVVFFAFLPWICLIIPLSWVYGEIADKVKYLFKNRKNRGIPKNYEMNFTEQQLLFLYDCLKQYYNEHHLDDISFAYERFTVLHMITSDIQDCCLDNGLARISFNEFMQLKGYKDNHKGETDE